MSGCATRPRSARRSSGCGRCSRRPSCCTTCSARRRCIVSAASKWLTDDESRCCSATAATTSGRCCYDRRRAAPRRGARGAGLEAAPARNGETRDDEVRTYGHIVVDEAQDLSPMELRVLSRRSLSGSMTVVGDIAQATGAWAHPSWDEILDHLPDRRPARHVELPSATACPRPTFDFAAAVLAAAAPELNRPLGPAGRRAAAHRPVHAPTVSSTCGRRYARGREVSAGNVAVICPGSGRRRLAALERRGVAFGRATRRGLDRRSPGPGHAWSRASSSTPASSSNRPRSSTRSRRGCGPCTSR